MMRWSERARMVLHEGTVWAKMCLWNLGCCLPGGCRGDAGIEVVHGICQTRVVACFAEQEREVLALGRGGDQQPRSPFVTCASLQPDDRAYVSRRSAACGLVLQE